MNDDNHSGQQYASLVEIENSLPPPAETCRLESIRQKSRQLNRAVVVLDDDPTGTQTVHGVPVLTEWSLESIVAEFENQTPVFFLLTNSRSVSAAQAIEIGQSIGEVLMQAKSRTGRNFEIVSRSDSTLRGHYPAEVDAIAAAIGQSDAPQILNPFFAEGNRLTVNDVHYVAQGDQMVPAAQTPFARDTALGYANSNLKAWVEEKAAGRITRDQVVSISIENLRSDPASVRQQIIDLPAGSVCVVNSLVPRDLEVFVDCLLDASTTGKQFVYRTAASFVQILAGMETQPLLDRDQMVQPTGHGGLIVVGSYVPKTTDQLKALLKQQPNLASVELPVQDLIQTSGRATAISAATESLNRLIGDGQDAIIYTSRDYFSSGSADQDLKNGKLISSALVEIVAGVEVAPSFLIAKGGITSSDVATEALQVRRATGLGKFYLAYRCGNWTKAVVIPGWATSFFLATLATIRHWLKRTKN